MDLFQFRVLGDINQSLMECDSILFDQAEGLPSAGKLVMEDGAPWWLHSHLARAGWNFHQQDLRAEDVVSVALPA